MNNPLVTVICLCYNHAKYVTSALEAVEKQSYDAIQLIIVDDASTDESKTCIKEWLKNRKDIPFIDHEVNIGNTKAFNSGLQLARGKYIIDLAADDILHVDRIARQVDFFEQQEENVGVIYSNARYVDKDGLPLTIHFDDPTLVAYTGDIYERVIDTYFIPTPTMMIKKVVLDELGGYDESLAYEDFDFWIRSARKWNYAYQDAMLTGIRLLANSQSKGYFDKSDQMMRSTLLVCYKIKALNRTKREDEALINRLKYEIRHAFVAGKKSELMAFYDFWGNISTVEPNYIIIKCIGKLGIKFNWMRFILKSAYSIGK